MATVAMLRTTSPNIDGRAMRTALRERAFNSGRREDAPAEVVAILEWVRRNSQPLSEVEDKATMRQLLTAVSTKLDGTVTARSSFKRNLAILHNTIEHATEKRLIGANLVKTTKLTTAGLTGKASPAIDRRCLTNREQARKLPAAVATRQRTGKRLSAFFATLHCAGLRPEEAVMLRVRDLTIPDDGGWGEILAFTTAPEVGSQWTTTGTPRDRRHLKGRPPGEVRPVPCHPTLTTVLRDHVKALELEPDDRLFTGERGGDLAGSVIRRSWSKARAATLTEAERTSPLAKRVYDLRHACLTNWLNAGVPPADVARWAGNSVSVLLATYVNCIEGQDDVLKKRIEDALPPEEDDPPVDG
jgi:integrase